MKKEITISLSESELIMINHALLDHYFYHNCRGSPETAKIILALRKKIKSCYVTQEVSSNNN